MQSSQTKAAQQRYREANREKRAAAWQEWAKANPELASKRRGNPEKRRETWAAYYAANKERLVEAARQRRIDNPKASANASKKYNEARREQRRTEAREYAKQHPEKRAASQARRRARLANPQWADKAEIEAIYSARPSGYHVDHIVPLKGLTLEGYPVSGLHVPWNLQYLPGEENLRKGSRA